MALDKGQVIALKVVNDGATFGIVELEGIVGGERFATLRAAQAFVRSDALAALEESEDDDDVQIAIVEVRAVARVVVERKRSIVFDDAPAEVAKAEGGEA